MSAHVIDTSSHVASLTSTVILWLVVVGRCQIEHSFVEKQDLFFSIDSTTRPSDKHFFLFHISRSSLHNEMGTRGAPMSVIYVPGVRIYPELPFFPFKSLFFLSSLPFSPVCVIYLPRVRYFHSFSPK